MTLLWSLIIFNYKVENVGTHLTVIILWFCGNILQLKVMAPCALLAALIGLGFGSLSANGIYGIPSISPALSSISILAAVFLHVVLSSWLVVSPSQQALAGGVSLALGSTCGAFLQWGIQVIAQRRAGLDG